MTKNTGIDRPKLAITRYDFLVRLVETGAGISASRRAFMCRSIAYSMADPSTCSSA